MNDPYQILGVSRNATDDTGQLQLLKKRCQEQAGQKNECK